MSVISDISELTPAAQRACRLFLDECKRRSLKVRITETYRTQERQNELYARGRTKPGKIVTWTKNSRHTSRRAWDICKNVKGEEYSDTAFFKSCGAVAKELGITWGGAWKTPDMPHFEIDENWRECDGMTDSEREKFNLLVRQVEKLTLENDILKRAMGWNSDDPDEPALYSYNDENIRTYISEDAPAVLDALIKSGRLAVDDNGAFSPLPKTALRLLVIGER